jgi:hypothetical protein
VETGSPPAKAGDLLNRTRLGARQEMRQTKNPTCFPWQAGWIIKQHAAMQHYFV